VFGVPESEVTSAQRGRAKTINFAVIYGMSAFRLASELGVTQPVASEWRKVYFDNYRGVKEYSDSVLELAREKGYVTTLLGRRRYVPDITSRVFQFRQAAEREAVNMTVQGTAADIIKLAMLRVDKALTDEGFEAKMVLQVHDELLFECPESEAERLAVMVKREMEAAFDLGDVPLKADVKKGMNWSEMTKIL
jgi:DNA polymerase-1